jgi:hypothetical protein
MPPSARSEVKHLFYDSFGTEILGTGLGYVKLSSLNRMLDSEEAPLVSSSVAEN